MSDASGSFDSDTSRHGASESDALESNASESDASENNASNASVSDTSGASGNDASGHGASESNASENNASNASMSDASGASGNNASGHGASESEASENDASGASESDASGNNGHTSETNDDASRSSLIEWTSDIRMPTDNPALERNRIAETVVWLTENPSELSVTAFRIFLCHKRAVQQAVKQAKNQNQNKRGEINPYGSHNKILTDTQEHAIHQYCHCQWEMGLGATKQIVFECAVHLRKKEREKEPS